jgi:hypothetical protein
MLKISHLGFVGLAAERVLIDDLSTGMQPNEKRKNLRRSIAYPAFLDFGDGLPVRECKLCDASQEGAQLAVSDPNGVPEQFILALSSDGAARRHCRVVWRTETQIGVVFLKTAKSPVPSRTQAAYHPDAALPADNVAAEPAALPLDIEALQPR